MEERGQEAKKGLDWEKEEEKKIKIEMENPQATNYLLDPAMPEASPAQGAFKCPQPIPSVFFVEASHSPLQLSCVF